jgi:hypothetical protein
MAVGECMEQKLLIPARKILRRIFDGTWRFKGND